MFDYSVFDKHGKQVIADTCGKNSEMLMDISVYKLKAGEGKIFIDSNNETAILLLKGKIMFEYENSIKTVIRKEFLGFLPSCLHFSRCEKVKVTAVEDSEILVQKTHNERDFETKLYMPCDIEVSISCGGVWEDTARREVLTVFDYNNAPYSNMVLGEIFVPQGRWFSYIPHSHPQPEVYYYRFQREEGFGACFIGEDAYTIKNGSFGAFPGGKTHAQVTAPGYSMYCCWMIRHLEGNPWKRTRIDDERYTWLLNNK